MTSKNLIRLNKNPEGKNIDDCVIRAISKSEERDYNEVLEDISSVLGPGETYQQSNINSKYLTDRGYKRFLGNFKTFQNMYGTRYGITTVNMAALLSQAIGKKVIVVTNSHMVACDTNGKFYDTWDSSRRRAMNLYIEDGDNFFKDIIKDEKYIINHWFERLPNGTVNLFKELNIIASWKNGERIS